MYLTTSGVRPWHFFYALIAPPTPLCSIVRVSNVSSARAQAYNNSMTSASLKPTISIDLLNQIDVRVGKIEAVEDVEGSDKLVKLRVNFGDFTRTIVAGMKQERANTREIEGKQALFVVNLEPRKMRGVVSEGMLFDIGYADGIRPVLAVPEEEVPNGVRAG
jgi:tRNA-binding protein